MEDDIKPFRDVLLGLFLSLSACCSIGIRWPIAGPIVLLVFVALIALKFLLIALIGMALKTSARWHCAAHWRWRQRVQLRSALTCRIACTAAPVSTIQAVLAAMLLSMSLPLILMHSEKIVLRLVASGGKCARWVAATVHQGHEQSATSSSVAMAALANLCALSRAGRSR